eukprot:3161892-Pleurochrysis_carterae.AAC.4
MQEEQLRRLKADICCKHCGVAMSSEDHADLRPESLLDSSERRKSLELKTKIRMPVRTSSPFGAFNFGKKSVRSMPLAVCRRLVATIYQCKLQFDLADDEAGRQHQVLAAAARTLCPSSLPHFQQWS